MKREIVCMPCYKKLKRIFPNDNPHPGEYVKFVIGTSKRNYQCDSCGDAIAATSKCVAFSIWSDHIPYTLWEDGYINKED